MSATIGYAGVRNNSPQFPWLTTRSYILWVDCGPTPTLGYLSSSFWDPGWRRCPKTGFGKGKWGMAELEITFKSSAQSWTDQFHAHFICHRHWQTQVPHPWVGKVSSICNQQCNLSQLLFSICAAFLISIPFTHASAFTSCSLEFTSSGKPFPWYSQTISHYLLFAVMALVLSHSMLHNCNELFMQYLISGFPPRLQAPWRQTQHLLYSPFDPWPLENCLGHITYTVILEMMQKNECIS